VSTHGLKDAAAPHEGVLARLTVRRMALETMANVAASALVKGRGLVMIVLVTYVAGLAAYGIWTQVQVLVNLLAIVGGLGLFNGIVRLYPEAADAAARRSLFWGGATWVLAASGLAAVALWAAAPLLADLLGEGHDAWAFRLGGVLVIGLACRWFVLSWLRARDELHAFARWMSAGELLDFGLATALLFATGTIEGAIAGSAIAAILITAVLVVRIRRQVGGWTVAGTPHREMLRYSTPLVPLSLSDETLARGDRLVVGAVLGPLSAGLYAVVYSLASVVSLLHGALTTTFFPKQVRLQGDRDGVAHRWLMLLAAVFIAAALIQGILLLVVGDQLVGWMVEGVVPDENVPLLLLVLTIGVAIYGVGRIVSTKLLVDKRTGRAALVWGGAAVLNLALNLALVPTAGLMGAAIATVVSYGVALLVLVHMTRPRRASPATGVAT
jgi:O-antigen/teichoic acid export membrane protein